jgi:hypothetical protein
VGAFGGFPAIGAKLVEVGDHEERLAALAAALAKRPASDDDGFGGSL